MEEGGDDGGELAWRDGVSGGRGGFFGRGALDFFGAHGCRAYGVWLR
jgi:hypothetical protein